MKYFFFDTETTGLPYDYDASYTDIDNWPRLVQLAWIVYENKIEVVHKNYVIKPIGYTIPKTATDVHGITMKKALEIGHKVEKVLKEFLEDVKDADAIIGHNIDFDMKVVQSELFRFSMENDLEDMKTLDTMLLSTDFCKIPSKQYGYRYPKLIELYNKLFSESFENMHNAMADVEATARCFWAMLDRHIINKEEYPYLLSEEEKKELAKEYDKQAIEIVWGTRSGNLELAEKLYLKSAQLGSTEGMFKVAFYNMGNVVSLRKDYETALYWLEKIVSIAQKQKDNCFWYEESLKNLIRIHKEYGNISMVDYYNKLLEIEINQRIIDIKKKANDSESGYYTLVSSFYYGSNGFAKDRELALLLMEDGISRGYRSLYEMYSDCLRKKGDNRYFKYLLEDVEYKEKKLKSTCSDVKKDHNEQTASLVYKVQKEMWFTSRYRLIAEAYLKGFGVKQDINKAKSYIWKALNCDSNDEETTILLAKLCNGEYGESYINFDLSISHLESLPLEYLDDKYPYALLGDAYIGKSWRIFIKAKKCYGQYADIDNYKSYLRKRFCKLRTIIYLLITIAFLLLVFLLLSEIH